VQGKCAKLPATPVPPQVGYLGLSMLGSWLILRWALKQMDPNKNAKALAKARKKELAKRLGRPVNLDGQYEDVSGRRRPVCICAAAALRRVLPCLPSSVSCPFPTARALPHGACFTQVVAQAVINPAAIDVTLGDVGGLDHIIQDVTRNVITPMRHPELFASNLLRQKRGVLLYGPPGTGKTMLAKALARECNACFILLKSSTILSKWYGDSNKLVAAVWSLAAKLQPCILFIDEVDSLLGQRSHQEHEATTAIKTEFMQLWEGFETSGNSSILVLGATNKKDRLDDAVLRRFSLQYEVKLPNAAQREDILRLTLQRHGREIGPEYIDPELLPPAAATSSDGSSGGGAGTSTDGAALRWLAEQTDGFSGSDLVQLCSQAAAVPIQELIE
jgi:SpoVK/Ycf46/Vps4 family AAA+-type ATPase